MDVAKSAWKGARPAIVVVLAALGVGLASPDVMELIKENPIASASIPLLLALIEAGRNAAKHAGQ
jgi:hypothetical protein